MARPLKSSPTERSMTFGMLSLKSRMLERRSSTSYADASSFTAKSTR